MKRSLASLVMVSALVARAAIALGAAPASKPATTDLAPRFARDVAVLASDEMEGRGLGTAGLGRAADWIEKRVRAIGLAPAFPGGYRQDFDVKTGVALEEGNALEGVASGSWVPLGMSSPGVFAGELAFVGYGIEAPPIGTASSKGSTFTARSCSSCATSRRSGTRHRLSTGAGRAAGPRCATRSSRHASGGRPRSCS
jgi:hypothetical protein